MFSTTCKRTWELIETPEDLKQVVETQIKPYCLLEKVPKFALDVETFSLLDREDVRYEIPRPIRIAPRQVSNLFTKQSFLMEYEGYIATLQLGADPRILNKQWIFDVKKLGPQIINLYLKDIIENAYIIGHNLKYDMSFLVTHLDIWIKPERVRDTYLIDQAIIAGRNDKSALSDNYRRYLDYGFFISETGVSFSDYETFKGDMQSSDWAGYYNINQLNYGAQDVRLVHFVYERQKEEIKKLIKKDPHSGIMNTILNECALAPEIALIELRGVNYDLEYHYKEIIPFLEMVSSDAYDKAISICPNPNPIKMKGRGAAKYPTQAPINFNSSAQIPKILEMLGVKVPNSKEETLKGVRTEHPAVEFILNYKKANKLLSSFGYKLPKYVHENGKIHPNFRQIGTETGRFSSSKINLQNIPMKGTLFKKIKAGLLFRRAFVSDDKGGEEYKFIDVDYSNIEPRIICQNTKSPTLINAFKNNVDYHGLTAQLLLDLDEPPAKGTDEREITGKIGNLSLGYCAGWAKLQHNVYVHTLDREEGPVRWTNQEAKEKHAKYFEKLPEVKEAIDAVKVRVEAALSCHNSLGDFAGRRPIFVIHTKNKKRRRAFYLSKDQEEWARDKRSGDPREHILHRWHQVVEKKEVLDEEGNGTGKYYYKKSYYNEFNKTISNIAREAYNFLIQAEAADIMKKAMLNLSSAKLRDLGFDIWNEGIVLTIHDELLFRVHKDRAELAKKLVQEAMISAGEEVITIIPVKADPQIGINWGDAKP